MGAGSSTDEEAGDSAENRKLGGTERDNSASQGRKRISSQSSHTENGDQTRQKSDTSTRTVAVDAFLEPFPEEMKQALADEKAHIKELESDIGVAKLQAKETNNAAEELILKPEK